MQSLSDFIKNTNIEDEVFSEIESCLNEEETIVRNWSPEIEKNRRCCDFFLEKGCSALGWNGVTIVEVKLFLMPDTIMKARSQFEAYTSSFQNARKVLVYDSLQSVYIAEKEYDIICISLRELKEKSQESHIHDIKEIGENNNLQSQSEIKNRAKIDFHNSKISFFLGAGVSMDAKLPSWNTLLERLLVQRNQKPFTQVNEANAKSIAKACGDSSIITGRYVHNGYESDKEFADRIHDALYEKKEHSNLVDVICKAIKTKKISQIITYNYDDLIEQGLSEDDFYPVFCKNRLIDNRMPIFHVHGMLSENKKYSSYPILSEKDYHNLYKETHNSSNVVQLYALNNTVCYFIGFSMTDPNLRRLLDFSRSNESTFQIDASEVPHYVFMRKVKLEGEASSAVNEEHWKLQENMLRELGLNVIWYNEFCELPILIEEMIS